jgi:uncharacterized delta-60 repeat protein
LVLYAGASTSFAEVGQQWIVRHDGPAGLDDVAYAMTTDAVGNVYVTGSAAVGTSGSDCVTIKYDPAGVQQWIQTFNGNTHDSGYAIVTDDLGNVYVTGASNSYATDYLTLKYDASGTLQWARHYDGPITEDDTAGSIAVDADGSVYVTGYSTGDGTNWDYATIKYSALGQELWVRRFDVGGGEDVGTRVAVTDAGIVVTGRSNYDYTTLLYDRDGNQSWVATYDENSGDAPTDMKVDGDGNIYVTGMSSVGQNYDFATVKYDSEGNELWSRRFDGPHNNDYAYGLAVDGTGNVFVAGASSDDFATVKYDAAGNELWVRKFGAPVTADAAKDIAVDASGNAYVTGYSWGDATTQLDYATVSYDPSGATRWVERYNGPGNFYDQPHAVVVHPSGDAYVTGQSSGAGTRLDFATIKYSQATSDAPEPIAAEQTGLFGLQSGPNPFGSATTIRFTIPPTASSDRQSVRLAVYDARGQEVAVLAEGALPPGTHTRELDGSKLSSGVYYSRLQVGGVSETSALIHIE